MDVITLNSKIFNLSDKDTHHFNQKHKSYDEQTILEILDYQRKHKLNYIELATHFKLSRDTVAKWKKIFLV
ncbi:helix-turn-helix domain-containing protein [Chryseobacterium sp. CBo1]|uniref:helix-turn-helix domain-containing protein n=1 Tax=Chryseobacterium sp. CBo1 TaxID=1869230 RepID=UPI000AF6E4D2|nr:helix-turn-helix domain-containing protein [Chryseobacterium sp. CBo1]